MIRCVLFLLNARGYAYEYGCDCGGCGSCLACCGGAFNAGLPWVNNSGLFNSCAFVVDMLNASGVGARLRQVNGLQDIINVVAHCQPTDVVIEALYVAPSELVTLAAQFPNVRWIIRLHSEIPFLIVEGRALTWIYQYLTQPNVVVAANTARGRNDLQIIVKGYFPHWDQPTLNHRVLSFPNYYPTPAPLPRIPSAFGTLNVGCLGALRPLKNQVLQAVAAIDIAAGLNKRLMFHINTPRIEGGVPGILVNLRGLFANTVNATLVEHGWLPRNDFFELCRGMDLGMQVSFSETFNIVAADFATNNVPLLVSGEISWCDARIQAQPTDTADMVKKGQIALRAVSIIESNRRGLLLYNDRSRTDWLEVFGAADRWSAHPAGFAPRPTITSIKTHM